MEIFRGRLGSSGGYRDMVTRNAVVLATFPSYRLKNIFLMLSKVDTVYITLTAIL